MVEATAGYDGDPKLRTVFPAEHAPHGAARHSQIVEGPISFYALCEHHTLPFYGRAYVGYLTGGEMIGISKLTLCVPKTHPAQNYGLSSENVRGGQ